MFGKEGAKSEAEEKHQEKSQSGANVLLPAEANKENNLKKSIDNVHARLAMIIHAIGRRKVEECRERELWPVAKSHANHLRDETIQAGKGSGYMPNPPRHKVRGLIVWVSISISRSISRRTGLMKLKG